MDNKEVIDLIGAMNDYADKKNNQGLKNVLVITLIGIVSSIVASIIGYGWKEIITLRNALDEQKARVTKLETRHEVSLKEQNKVVYKMAEAITHVEEEVEKPKKLEKLNKDPKKPIEKLKTKKDPSKFFKNVEDDDKFKDFHKHFEQRVQDRLPMEQRTK